MEYMDDMECLECTDDLLQKAVVVTMMECVVIPTSAFLKCVKCYIVLEDMLIFLPLQVVDGFCCFCFWVDQTEFLY